MIHIIKSKISSIIKNETDNQTNSEDKCQVSQIYSRGKDEIPIKIPEVMKQNNSINCGLYAIAFVTSYCFRQKLCFELIFDSNKQITLSSFVVL